MTTPPNIVEINNLSHSFGKFELNIPKFAIKEGSSIGFSGQNGSGKTTLMRLISQLEKPQNGEIVLFNNNLVSTNTTDVTYLLQEPYLLKKTVFENIAYGLKQRKIKKNITEQVHEALEQTGLSPDKFSKRRWFELSGGEAQRVALASRLILKPKLMLLDEPVANIDVESAEIIKDVLQKMRKKFNTTLIISSHDKLWLNSVIDEIVNLHNGKITGSTKGNIIKGPWKEDIDGLWSKKIGADQKIFSTKPPEINSSALLEPTDIILSKVKPTELTAQNILLGHLTSMTTMNDSSKIEAQIKFDNFFLNCHITEHSINELKLIPGNKIWVIFKATSLEWI